MEEPSPRRRRSRWLVAAACVAFPAAGCAAAHGAGIDLSHARPTVPVAAGSTSTSTSAAMPPPTPPSRLPGLQMGDSGPAVLAMEQRLAVLHYDVGTPDGHFGPADNFAVIAFQKVHGMARTGRATDDVLQAMATAADPSPLVPGGGAMRVEVDLPRQVLFLYEHDALVRILPVSTGSGERYCVQGACDVAVTPGGSYRIGEKILGLQISRLGQLYNPLYFNGGIAIHGEPSVPSYPASHGCVRIPMNSSLWFFHEVPSGTPVYVVGGPNAPVPFHEQAPGSSTTPPTTSLTPAPTTPPTTASPPTTGPASTSTTSTTAPPPTTSTSAPATTTTSLAR